MDTEWEFAYSGASALQDEFSIVEEDFPESSEPMLVNITDTYVCWYWEKSRLDLGNGYHLLHVAKQPMKRVDRTEAA